MMIDGKEGNNSVEGFGHYTTYAIDIMMIIGPCVGYLIQANKFQTMKSSKGFSLYVCLIILISNILRIYFWIGKRFTIVLLFQSFVVILSQFYLIKVALEYSENIMVIKTKEDKLSLDDDSTIITIILYFMNHAKSVYQKLFSIESFWNYTHFSQYVLVIIIGTGGIGLICLIPGFSNEKFIELLGYLATGIEVVLGIPQIISNYRNKSTETLSFLMIIIWIFGDIFKTSYYIIMKSPFQFISCGMIQICLDIILIFQIFYYDYNQLPKTTNHNHKSKKNEENGYIGKCDDTYGTFSYSSDDDDIIITQKIGTEDDLLIKDYEL